MAFFTTRVELRGSPSKSDYDRLHAAMAKSGFKQTVEKGGKSFYLPHAEYDLFANVTVEDVMERARHAAESVWPNHLILVTEAKDRTWLLVPAT
jgi:hypothetical protein